MNRITTLGIDLAKSVFQVHGVDVEGRVVLRRQLKRSEMLAFFQRLPSCLIDMEARASAHYWARALTGLGHEARLMQPSYVKVYVKRGKTDAADAEAICEAVSRPSMRFVPVKVEATQALLMTHKVRELLVRQQTRIVNAMRAHLGAFGIVVPKGIHNVERLIMVAARKALSLLADQQVETQRRIEDLTADIRADAKADEDAQRLQTIPGIGPGIGPITASALVAALPDIADFKSGRDLSAWLGVRSVSRTDRVPARTTKAPFQRWQGAAGAHFQDGQQVSAQVAVSWLHRTGQCASAGRGRGRLALEDHQPQDAKTGRDRPGQPHGAHRLCADQEQDRIPGGTGRLTGA